LHGGLRSLSIKGDMGSVWADDAHPLVQPFYDAMSGDFFHTFVKEYNVRSAQNFDKPNDKEPAMSANATLVSLLYKKSSSESRFVLGMTMPSDVHTQRGAPSSLSALLIVPHAPDTRGFFNLSYSLQWADKTPTHLPETLWLLNRPKVTNEAGWRIDKLGSAVDPRDADLGFTDGTCDPTSGPTTCGVHLHAVGEGGASYRGQEGNLVLRSLDTMLVSVGEPIAVPTPLKPPDVLGGVHFSLVDNIWNTNYPMWYPFKDGDEASQFRFELSIKAPTSSHFNTVI